MLPCSYGQGADAIFRAQQWSSVPRLYIRHFAIATRQTSLDFHWSRPQFKPSTWNPGIWQAQLWKCWSHCWTLSASLPLPAFANIAKWLHNANKCFIIETYPSEALCPSEPQTSSAAAALLLAVGLSPFPCAWGTAGTWGQPGDWGVLLWKQWFLLESKIPAQYQVTWVSQKTTCLLTRNWGFLIQSFSSQYFLAQWHTRTSCSKISYQPASGTTGNQAQHQPHHSFCTPQVRGTLMVSILYEDL